MRPAGHLTALRTGCKQCRPGRWKPDMLRPGIVGKRGSMVIRLRPCLRSSTSLLSSTPPLPPRRPVTRCFPLSAVNFTATPSLPHPYSPSPVCRLCRAPGMCANLPTTQVGLPDETCNSYVAKSSDTCDAEAMCMNCMVQVRGGGRGHEDL